MEYTTFSILRRVNLNPPPNKKKKHQGHSSRNLQNSLTETISCSSPFIMTGNKIKTDFSKNKENV